MHNSLVMGNQEFIILKYYRKHAWNSKVAVTGFTIAQMFQSTIYTIARLSFKANSAKSKQSNNTNNQLIFSISLLIILL
jgi:hypothetical protein